VARRREHILLDRLFAAMQARDAKAMAECYHEDAHFRDPVFDVRGDDVKRMWAIDRKSVV
jgi:ketosteroid isomerase-like protein